MKQSNHPLCHYRTLNLISVYEELFHVPQEERVTSCFPSLNTCFRKYGSSKADALTSYEKALAAIQMDSDTFQRSPAFIYRSQIIARMWNGMLDDDTRLTDVLSQEAARNAVLLHEDAPRCRAPINRLIDSEKEGFAALLNASVREIRAEGSAIEVVVSGVEPETLMRLGEDFSEPERAMGLAMG